MTAHPAPDIAIVDGRIALDVDTAQHIAALAISDFDRGDCEQRALVALCEALDGIAPGLDLAERAWRTWEPRPTTDESEGVND